MEIYEGLTPDEDSEDGQFISDLRELIDEYIAKGNDVVLALSVNDEFLFKAEVRTKIRKNFFAICTEREVKKMDEEFSLIPPFSFN